MNPGAPGISNSDLADDPDEDEDEDEEEGVESSDELEIDAENTIKEAYSDNADSSDDEKK